MCIRDRGEAALAKEYAQIYDLVIGLFDKLADILGEEELSLAEYQQLLEAGLLEAQVGIIPPMIDQVLSLIHIYRSSRGSLWRISGCNY